MCNSGQSLIPFHWDQQSTPQHILLVEPSCGELPACTELGCELSISAQCPGTVDEDLLCHLGHVDQTVSLHVSAVVKHSEFTVDEPELDFGLIRFEESGTRTLTIRNPGRSPVEWTVRLSPSATADVDVEEFTFRPSCGTVWPLDACQVEVTVCPKRCRSFDTVLEVTSADGGKSVVGVSVQVQHPRVCLLESSVHAVAYVDAKTSCTAVLFNQTPLSTTFQWGEAVCTGTMDVDIDIEPKSGVIEARQMVTVSISLTPHGMGPTDVIVVPCCVQGMDAPVHLSISATVRDLALAVVYSVSADKESWLTRDGVIVDFGADNRLLDVPKRYLRIQNNSSMATDFQLEMESFPSAVRAGELKEEQPGGRGCRNGPAQLLKKTANLADPTAKTGAKAAKELRDKMLSGGSGVAFYLNPSSGKLAPFAEVIVEITAYADLWGFYSDLLRCRIGDLDLYTIPVTMSTSGSPILFQMVLHDPSLEPIVRFGCVVEGTGPVTRRTRILNRSLVDIRIDWQTLNVSPEDDQLMDLIVTFGKPFPLRDKNGNEIITQSADGGFSVTEDNYRQLAPVAEEALEELATSRPQLISLSLREHDGTEATAPYSIEPSQLVRFTQCVCCRSSLTT